jgi:hypothetical protein
VVDGAVWLRICVQSLHTHAQHVEELVDAVLDAASCLELTPGEAGTRISIGR